MQDTKKMKTKFKKNMYITFTIFLIESLILLLMTRLFKSY